MGHPVVRPKGIYWISGVLGWGPGTAVSQAESYNAFCGRLAFGSEVIERNDPAEQEKVGEQG